MIDSDPKVGLQLYLQFAREALLWKLDGLSEYDVRRSLTPTGTNLLGLVKHAASIELGYLGDSFGRPSGETPPSNDLRTRPSHHGDLAEVQVQPVAFFRLVHRTIFDREGCEWRLT
jgi:hypothetical protein